MTDFITFRESEFRYHFAMEKAYQSEWYATQSMPRPAVAKAQKPAKPRKLKKRKPRYVVQPLYTRLFYAWKREAKRLEGFADMKPYIQRQRLAEARMYRDHYNSLR